MMNTKLKVWLAVGLMACAGGVVGLSPAAMAQDTAKPEAKEGDTQDVLIFRTGNVLYGKILSETATTVRFKGMIAGISAETDFPKFDLLEIKRGAAVKPGEGASGVLKADAAKSKIEASKNEPVNDGVARTKYYWITLEGDLGREISETPIRKAMLDARDNGAEVVIMHLNATWFDQRGQREKEDFEGSFDQLGRATAIMQTLVNDVPVDFSGKPPRIVFWVEKAMGGPAFIPLVSKEIYFHPEGKLGGIGGLDQMMSGHVRVVEKQISLRLQRAAGWANVGGYPEELVRALALTRTVLSARFDGGQASFFEGYPGSPGEVMLTDDGAGENEDTIDALARGEGNDVLTLNAELARRIQVSDGTAATKAELLNLLGLDRGGIEVKGKSEGITKDWTRGLDNAQAQIMRLMEEYGEIEVRGERASERNRLRAAQINKLEQIKSLLTRWKEGLAPQWLVNQRLPITDEGAPDTAALTAQQEAIRIAIMKDRD